VTSLTDWRMRIFLEVRVEWLLPLIWIGIIFIIDHRAEKRYKEKYGGNNESSNL